MSQVHDLAEFVREVATAHAAHQAAIKIAQSNFEAACQTAVRDWRKRVDQAIAAFDGVKSEFEPGEGYKAINREFYRARTSTPDTEGARQQLAKDVAAADVALNRALAAAKQKLLIAAPPS